MIESLPFCCDWSKINKRGRLALFYVLAPSLLYVVESSKDHLRGDSLQYGCILLNRFRMQYFYTCTSKDFKDEISKPSKGDFLTLQGMRVMWQGFSSTRSSSQNGFAHEWRKMPRNERFSFLLDWSEGCHARCSSILLEYGYIWRLWMINKWGLCLKRQRYESIRLA